MRLIYCLLHDFSHSLYREIIIIFFNTLGFVYSLRFYIVCSSTVHDVLHLIDVRFIRVLLLFSHSFTAMWFVRDCAKESVDEDVRRW